MKKQLWIPVLTSSTIMLLAWIIQIKTAEPVVITKWKTAEPVVITKWKTVTRDVETCSTPDYRRMTDSLKQVVRELIIGDSLLSLCDTEKCYVWRDPVFKEIETVKMKCEHDWMNREKLICEVK